MISHVFMICFKKISLSANQDCELKTKPAMTFPPFTFLFRGK